MKLSVDTRPCEKSVDTSQWAGSTLYRYAIPSSRNRNPNPPSGASNLGIPSKKPPVRNSIDAVNTTAFLFCNHDLGEKSN